MYRHPQITPYKSSFEFEQLKKWFYSADPKLRARAVQKVAAYATKGSLPHSLESTSLLTSAALLDEQLSSTNDDPMPIRLSYAMSLIKFCNGLLDPIQKSTYAMSLNRLAEILQLPTHFVEIRHAGTHEMLPSLEMLRFSAQSALGWLETNYWNEVVENTSSEPPEEKTDQEIDALTESFKKLRKIRREDIHKVYKFGDSTETGSKYWQAMKVLKSVKQNVLLNFMVYESCLVLRTPLNEKKVNGIRLLYKPILEELGYDVVLGLFQTFLAADTKNELFSEQRTQWLQYFLSNSLTFSQNSIYSKFVNVHSVGVILALLARHPLESTVTLLETLSQHKQLLEQTKLTAKVNDQIKFMRTFYVSGLSSQPALKKQKSESLFLFEQHELWEPKPFGQP
ncbi:hypothetical protein KL930_003118 [Ogataea haglerorum]|nr:hypothetical protein KL914_002976 [Ogataea haglerorum]KAG7708601.1 hypothetical protein KL950_002121 [Ogataea haglerorum]KAG7713771.1 hypothetical protein KL913_004795 [Ogataea haglerorum]KAG7714204.1 hypothetical protein KL949_004834 [Ogataea haglerorum]KAG7734395.1 hypothetical protein KL932_004849 [Ogataea haglerorum]